MVDAAIEAMLNSKRAFVVAAAGCGKTESIARFVADQRSGRQLLLTHTHAGVAAIRKRLAARSVPQEKFHLDTIAGWCLRLGVAYPAITNLRRDAEADPNWAAVYPGAAQLCRSGLGRRIIQESYDGVLVDEYQDCATAMHAVVRAIGESIPYRGVGDPLQAVFGFRDDPVVSRKTIKEDFDVFGDALLTPWRWRRHGHNAALGNWLVDARRQLESKNRLVIAEDAPVAWIRIDSGRDAPSAWADACRDAGPPNESVVAILKWSTSCIELAKRLGGRWPIVERFDEPDLMKLGKTLADADGTTVVAKIVEFVAPRMTRIGTELRPMVEAIKAGRGLSRFKNNREHGERLAAIAHKPTPANVLIWLDAVLAQRDDWWLYRRECVFQLRAALRECADAGFAELPDAVAAARTRARHRGRQMHRRTIGTPLLVKGLEFDHAVLLWEPNHLSVQGLYVALTRGSKSLTIVSRSRTLMPEPT